MDIRKFDELYPTPAHAAAAERRDRHEKQKVVERHRRDRRGAISIAVALSIVTGGVLLLVESVLYRPTLPIRKTISVPDRIPYYQQVSTASTSFTQDIAVVPVHLASREEVEDSGEIEHDILSVSESSEMTKVRISRQVDARWIAESRSAEVLRAALIIDKRKTVEMNAEQLRLMAEARQKSSSIPATEGSVIR